MNILMLPLPEELEQVNNLRMELDALRPLSADVEQRVMQKLRLEWNYHSARIQGGQLTFGEARTLILFDITAGQKPLRDHLEMKGHNEAISFLLNFTRKPAMWKRELLTEYALRGLHETIVGEPYEIDTLTFDGKPTKRAIHPGAYKRVPNYIRTATGEIFYFVAPAETPAAMKDLMDWYVAEEENGNLHPVFLAAELHYRFVRIHPFDDGNGRMARLLMNMALLWHGFPPAVIRSESKEEYFRVLAAADAGDIKPFMTFVAHETAHSLEITLRAARGEEIDEEDYVYREIDLLRKKLEDDGKNLLNVKRSPLTIKNICLDSIVPLFEMIAGELSHLDDFFTTRNIQLEYNTQKFDFILKHHSDGTHGLEPGAPADALSAPETPETLLQWFEEKIYEDIANIRLVYRLEGFKYNGGISVGHAIDIRVHFDKYKYVVALFAADIRIEKKYDTHITKKEQRVFARQTLGIATERIKHNIPPDIE